MLAVRNQRLGVGGQTAQYKQAEGKGASRGGWGRASTAQPEHENGNEALYQTDERFQQENSESRGDGGDLRRTLQFSQNPQDAEDHSEHGRWSERSCLES